MAVRVTLSDAQPTGGTLSAWMPTSVRALYSGVSAVWPGRLGVAGEAVGGGAVQEPVGFSCSLGVGAPGRPRTHRDLFPPVPSAPKGPGAKLCQRSICGMADCHLHTQLRITYTLRAQAQVPKGKTLVIKGDVFHRFPLLNAAAPVNGAARGK